MASAFFFLAGSVAAVDAQSRGDEPWAVTGERASTPAAGEAPQILGSSHVTVLSAQPVARDEGCQWGLGLLDWASQLD